MMVRFATHEILAAHAYAAKGGQALHVWEGTHWPGSSPACFRVSHQWGHLIDADEERLIATARRLGVRKIHVSKPGRQGQHIDLCGAPLRKAIAEAIEKEE